MILADEAVSNEVWVNVRVDQQIQFQKSEFRGDKDKPKLFRSILGWRSKYE